MEKIIQEYYVNDAKKLHEIVDKILKKIGGISDKDKDDFYSAASFAIVEEWKKNNFKKEKGSLEGYIYKVINFAVLSELRDRNRYRRSNTRPKRDRNGNIIKNNGKIEYEFVPDISLELEVSEDGGIIGDFIADDFSVEQEILKEDREIYSDKMLRYLNQLSELQKEILRLNIAGYTGSEIIIELHISQREYSECNAAIHSYRNVSVLF